MIDTAEEQSTESKGGKTKRKIVIFVAAAIVLVAGVFLFYFPNRQTLVRVNDEKVTVEQFNKDIAKLEDPLMRDMLREEPEKFLEGMIMKRVLLQEAKKQGFSAPVKTFKDAEKNAPSPEEAIVTGFLEKKFSSPPEVGNEEIEAFYKIYKDQMQGKPLKEVTLAIEQLIREMKQREALGQFLEELRKNTKVEINQERLRKIAAKAPESNTEEDFKQALTSGKPVLVDFGANSCIPCRQLRPILREIDKEYTGRARTLVIDVYKYQNLAREYKVQLIPTLVFFDSNGKEVFRHVGVLEKEKIVAKLKEIGMGT